MDAYPRGKMHRTILRAWSWIEEEAARTCILSPRTGLMMKMPTALSHSTATPWISSRRMGVPQRYLRQLHGRRMGRYAAAHCWMSTALDGTQPSIGSHRRTGGKRYWATATAAWTALNPHGFRNRKQLQGAVISDAYMNDTKVWAETYSHSHFYPDSQYGEVIIFAGAPFHTSDYGDALLNAHLYASTELALTVWFERALCDRFTSSSSPTLSPYQKRRACTQQPFQRSRLDSGFTARTRLCRSYREQGASENDVTPRDPGSWHPAAKLLKQESKEVKILMRNDPRTVNTGRSYPLEAQQGYHCSLKRADTGEAVNYTDFGRMMNLVKL